MDLGPYGGPNGNSSVHIGTLNGTWHPDTGSASSVYAACVTFTGVTSIPAMGVPGNLRPLSSQQDVAEAYVFAWMLTLANNDWMGMTKGAWELWTIGSATPWAMPNVFGSQAGATDALTWASAHGPGDLSGFWIFENSLAGGQNFVVQMPIKGVGEPPNTPSEHETPEPSSIALAGIGLVAAGIAGKRR